MPLAFSTTRPSRKKSVAPAATCVPGLKDRGTAFTKAITSPGLYSLDGSKEGCFQIIRQTGSVSHEAADRDGFPLRREVGDKLADRVIHTDLARLDQLHDSHGRVGLSDLTDIPQGLR